MSVWADHGAALDHGVLGHRARLEMHVVTNRDIDQVHARLDDASRADRGRTFDRYERIDDGVIADGDGRVDNDRGWIAECDTVVHQPGDNAPLDLSLDRR